MAFGERQFSTRTTRSDTPSFRESGGVARIQCWGSGAWARCSSGTCSEILLRSDTLPVIRPHGVGARCAGTVPGGTGLRPCARWAAQHSVHGSASANANDCSTCSLHLPMRVKFEGRSPCIRGVCQLMRFDQMSVKYPSSKSDSQKSLCIKGL